MFDIIDCDITIQFKVSTGLDSDISYDDFKIIREYMNKNSNFLFQTQEYLIDLIHLLIEKRVKIRKSSINENKIQVVEIF
jgi:hypothetical protein